MLQSLFAGSGYAYNNCIQIALVKFNMGLPHSGSDLSLVPRPVCKTGASLGMRLVQNFTNAV